MVNPLFAIFVPFRATDRQTALTRTSAESVGKPGTLLRIVPLTGKRETLRIFCTWPYLRSLRRPVSLVILLTFSFLRITSSIYFRVSRFFRTYSPLVVILLRRSPTKRASKGAGKDKDSSAKRSNSAPSPTFNICFANSQEFNSLVANSAELEGITSKGNNESIAVRNISNERSNVINDNTSANSTERSNEVINDTSANATERVNEIINNSSTERSNEVNDITVHESNESSADLNEVNAINLNVAVVENVAEMESVDVMAGSGATKSGRPLNEVIDEGQVDLSSDGIESFEDSSSPS